MKCVEDTIVYNQASMVDTSAASEVHELGKEVRAQVLHRVSARLQGQKRLLGVIAGELTGLPQ